MRMVLVQTGGTIGASRGRSGVGIRRSGRDRFARLLKAALRREGIGPGPAVVPAIGKLSENITPSDWVALARVIHRQIGRGAAGIVVAHGTDTLVYSACAIHWLLREVPVPIVFTGSRIPLGDPASDAPRNVAHALRVASAGRSGVWISFAGSAGGASLVLDPRNARKDARLDACFQPVWGGPAGRVDAQGRVSWSMRGQPVASVRTPCSPRYEPQFRLCRKAALFLMHPGFEPSMLRLALDSGAQGLVLAGYGSGTACAARGGFDLRPAVREAAAREAPVWMVTQHGGRVAEVYDSTAGLVRCGLRVKPGWTPEAALTALMCRLDADAEAGYREQNQPQEPG